MPSKAKPSRMSLLSEVEEAELQARMAAAPDARELTDDELLGMRPAREVLPPALFKTLTRRGRPKSENKRVQVTLRVDPDVLEAYRASGPGWQTRMNDALASGAKRLSPSRSPKQITSLAANVLAGGVLSSKMSPGKAAGTSSPGKGKADKRSA